MGQDKALLPIAGKPMLQQISEIAESLGDRHLVVTPWGDRYQAILSKQWEFVAEVWEEGAIAPPGPLIGFAQGLCCVTSEWVLLLACDLPNLHLATLQQGMTQLDSVDESVCAVLTKDDRGWQPLCGFYRVRCLPDLEQFIASGGRSFQRWLASLTVQEWQVADEEMFYNCNTPEDWQQWGDRK